MEHKAQVTIKSVPEALKGEWEEVPLHFERDVHILDLELQPIGAVSSDFWVDVGIGLSGQEQPIATDMHFSEFVRRAKWIPQDPVKVSTARLVVRAQAQEPGRQLHLLVVINSWDTNA